MKSFFKIFKNADKQLTPIDYIAENDYYQYLFNQRKKGYEQFLLTSNLMLRVMLSVIKEGGDVSDLHLFDDDDKRAKKSILETLRFFKENKENVEDVYSKLKYIDSEQSVDVESITIRYKEAILTVQSNGIVALLGESKELEDFIQLVHNEWLGTNNG